MRNFADRLDAIRDRPHHVRRQIAFLASGVITGVIAVGWLGASLYTGAFALKGANFAEVGATPITDDSSNAFDTGVAGVAAAAVGAEDTVAPGLNVVSGGEGGSSTADPSNPKSGQNIIPF